VTPVSREGEACDERWRDELAAHALDSLDQTEARALEAHLAGCERCRDELRWLRTAVEALPASVPQLEPPRRLRRRVLAAARAEPRSSRARGLGRPPRLAWMTPATATAAVAAVALAAGAGYLVGEDGPESSTVSAAAQTARAAGAGGLVVTNGDEATLEVEGMPRLAAGHVYQAWLQRGSEIEPSTTFIVDRHGDGAAAVPHVGGAERLMVTSEPRGGSEVPSTEPLLSATLN
jgi:anti-sigma factor RsiW